MNRKKSTKLAHSGLHALVWQEDDLFVAKCVEIEVASQGASEDAAIKNLDEALELFFEDVPSKVPGLVNLQIVSL